jgi:tetratricopeptide (TPR) repeat protein
LKDRVGEARALLQLGQLEARAASESPELARTHLGEALELFEQVGSLRFAGHAHAGLGVSWAQVGRYEKAEAEYRRALERYREGGDQNGIASAQGDLGGMLILLGELTAGEALIASALELNRRLGNRQNEANTLTNQSELLLLLGRLADARTGYAAALEIHQQHDNPGGMAIAQLGMAKVLRMSGEAAAARALLELVLPAAQKAQEPELLNECSLLQMTLDADAGEPDRVLSRRSEWSELFSSSDRLGIQARAHGLFALALLAKGKLAEATTESDEASRLVQSSEEVQAQADAMLTSAKVKSASGDREGALSLLHGSLELARRAGRPTEYETELTVAELEKAQRLPGWRAKLESMATRAKQEQFVLYANRAAAVLQSN